VSGGLGGSGGTPVEVAETGGQVGPGEGVLDLGNGDKMADHPAAEFPLEGFPGEEALAHGAGVPLDFAGGDGGHGRQFDRHFLGCQGGGEISCGDGRSQMEDGRFVNVKVVDSDYRLQAVGCR